FLGPLAARLVALVTKFGWAKTGTLVLSKAMTSLKESQSLQIKYSITKYILYIFIILNYTILSNIYHNKNIFFIFI
ncbi:hypothetical protein, partial [Staphylococcus aureus]|uniref:hypothetical protein n=1 Tax=Staphylococcus aureus TaxID=1280 RepID=UPI00210E8407